MIVSVHNAHCTGSCGSCSPHYIQIHITHARPCPCVGEQRRIGVHIDLRPFLHATIWYRTSSVVCLAPSSTYLSSARPKTVPSTSAKLTLSSLSLLRLVYYYFDCISSLGINMLVGIDYNVIQAIIEQHCTFSLDQMDKLATYSLH
jgi:hypothetical protein